MAKCTNRNGDVVSAQISVIGGITDLDTAAFSLGGKAFNVKNDGDDAVELDVNLFGMPKGEFVKTKFDAGWNPEIIREIKADDTLSDINLKYGY
ncbi:MAG: hypothetical protein LKK19_01845 [Bacteroidales bacterium]|jgi:hypothetical protein|nr:hypothetical protein [Bacteroidales bacterium]MCI2145853.1 hypothetical protein [Bacteroidales bacterium]